jgi:hypothetical protein
MQRIVVAGVVVLGAIACGGKSRGGTGSRATAVNDEGFSHACATDDDCVLVELGDTCGICNFSNAAIAKSAQSAWQKAYNTARSNCPEDHAVGKCAARYGVSRCNESKSCTYVACAESPISEHRCTSEGGH